MGNEQSELVVSQRISTKLSSVRKSGLNNDSPLQRERRTEEQTYRLMEEMHAPQITRVVFRLDENKDFAVVMESGLERGKRYIICIKLGDHHNITCSESKSIQAALKASERSTILAETQFRNWASQFEEMGCKVTLGTDTNEMFMMTVRPKLADDNEILGLSLPGLVRKTRIDFNDQGDVCITFGTDVETYVISVHLNLIQGSYSEGECAATRDVLCIAEQGDKMDDSIFFQYCARLKQRYKLLRVMEADGIKIAYVLPSKLRPEEADVTMGSEFPLPAVTEGSIDWDQATHARVEQCILNAILEMGTAVANPRKADRRPQQHSPQPDSRPQQSGPLCTYCSSSARGGPYHYQCAECSGTYILCSECYDASRTSKDHQESHAMRRVPNQTPTTSPTSTNPSTSSNSSSHNSLPLYDKGRIRATTVLKESGQANVYKATMETNTNEQKVVAIKVFHNKTDWRECKQELITLLRLPIHPNVMEVMDFYEVPKPAFVMKFVHGGDLRDRLRKGRLSIPEAGNLLAGIGEGLRHLHSHNIVHRDMKSPNILLEQEGCNVRPVLIDLALGSQITGDATHAITSHMAGTPAWMAPEMIQRSEYGTKSDMYAVGIIMWEMLTGKIPFEGTPPMQLVFMIASGSRPDIDALSVAGLSTRQEQLIKDLWSESPNERPDVVTFLSRLRTTFPMRLQTDRRGQQQKGQSVWDFRNVVDHATRHPDPVSHGEVGGQDVESILDFRTVGTPSDGVLDFRTAGEPTRPRDKTTLAPGPQPNPRRGEQNGFDSALDFRKTEETAGPQGRRAPTPSPHRNPRRGEENGVDSVLDFRQVDETAELRGRAAPARDPQPKPREIKENATGKGLDLRKVGEKAEPRGKTPPETTSGSVSSGLSSILDTFELMGLDEKSFVTSHTMRDPESKAYGKYIGFVDQRGRPRGHGVLRVAGGDGSKEEDLLCAEWAGDKTVGFGIRVMNSNEKHFGAWKDGKPHGIGVHWFSDKSFYFGEYSHGERHGLGKMVYANGTYYEGNFAHNHRSGYGVLFARDGSAVYKGGWDLDAQDSRSSHRSTESNLQNQTLVRAKLFKDPWGVNGLYGGSTDREGRPHGWGSIRYSTTNTREAYFAEFVHGKVKGIGLYLWSNGKWYAGEWDKVKIHGRGITVEATGSIYLGHHERGSKNGDAMLLTDGISGSLYQGEVHNGKPHGKGNLYMMDGTRVCGGRWQHGRCDE